MVIMVLLLSAPLRRGIAFDRKGIVLFYLASLFVVHLHFSHPQSL